MLCHIQHGLLAYVDIIHYDVDAILGVHLPIRYGLICYASYPS
jgi:hypothetical protein